jgi:hypothetical protein
LHINVRIAQKRRCIAQPPDVVSREIIAARPECLNTPKTRPKVAVKYLRRRLNPHRHKGLIPDESAGSRPGISSFILMVDKRRLQIQPHPVNISLLVQRAAFCLQNLCKTEIENIPLLESRGIIIENCRRKSGLYNMPQLVNV